MGSGGRLPCAAVICWRGGYRGRAAGSSTPVLSARYPRRRRLRRSAPRRLLPRAARDQRAEHLWQAAVIAREQGMELLGTEVEPDWFFMDGQYEPPSTVDERSRPGSRSSSAPVRTNSAAFAHEITPYVRFHYRLHRGGPRLAATELMPNGTDELAWRLWTAGSWLKYRERKPPIASTRRSSAGVELRPRQRGDRIRWFPRAVSQN